VLLQGYQSGFHLCLLKIGRGKPFLVAETPDWPALHRISKRRGTTVSQMRGEP
jgi:hypothetical protein